MRWSQLKTNLEALRAPALKKRVGLHQARYRYTLEEVGRIWLTIDSREIASFDTSSQYDDYQALADLKAYLLLSIDDALKSPSPLTRGLAVIDRRVGRRRLRSLDSLDADLDDHIRKSPLWRVREALLTSVPGVGRVTARTLLAEMPELGSLDRRQVEPQHRVKLRAGRIGVDQQHASAELRQVHGQVDGEAAGADPAAPTDHGNDVTHPWRRGQAALCGVRRRNAVGHRPKGSSLPRSFCEGARAVAKARRLG